MKRLPRLSIQANHRPRSAFSTLMGGTVFFHADLGSWGLLGRTLAGWADFEMRYAKKSLLRALVGSWMTSNCAVSAIVRRLGLEKISSRGARTCTRSRRFDHGLGVLWWWLFCGAAFLEASLRHYQGSLFDALGHLVIEGRWIFYR
jgi:hypothetical protein